VREVAVTREPELEREPGQRYAVGDALDRRAHAQLGAMAMDGLTGHRAEHAREMKRRHAERRRQLAERQRLAEPLREQHARGLGELDVRRRDRCSHAARPLHHAIEQRRARLLEPVGVDRRTRARVLERSPRQHVRSGIDRRPHQLAERALEVVRPVTVRSAGLEHARRIEREPLAPVPRGHERLARVLLALVVDHDDRRVGDHRPPPGMPDHDRLARKHDQMSAGRPRIAEPRVAGRAPERPDRAARSAIQRP